MMHIPPKLNKNSKKVKMKSNIVKVKEIIHKVTYLPSEMEFPMVMTERTTVITVPMGLKIDTKTGPLFFIAHPLKVTQTPLTQPP